MNCDTLVEPTIEESAVILATEARAALLKSAGDDFIKAKEAATAAGKLEIKAINLLRSCGSKLQEAADKVNLSFDIFRRFQDSLPKTLTYTAAKFCVHLAREMKEPAETLEDTRQIRRNLFEAFNQEQAPKRLEQQTARDNNPWCSLMVVSNSLTLIFDKLGAMDDWDKNKLAAFTKTTKPIVEQYEKAQTLLNAKL